jgi:hypothetical protein
LFKIREVKEKIMAIRKKRYRPLAILVVAMLLFSSAAWAVPLAPEINPPSGTYSDSVAGTVYNPNTSVGQVVYYTTDGSEPITVSGGVYTIAPGALEVLLGKKADFSFNNDGTVKAAAYNFNDNTVSDTVYANYVVKTVLERLQALNTILNKLARLSPTQMESVVNLVYKEIDILWNVSNPILSYSERTNLANNGLTAEALQDVVSAVRNYVNTSSSNGKIGYAGLVASIQPVPGRDFVYLGGNGAGLYQAVRNSFPQSFKDALAAKGTTIDELIDTMISLAGLNLVMGMTLTDEFKEQAQAIFQEKLVNTSNLTLQLLADNGLIFANAEELINRLSNEDKNTLLTAALVIGNLGVTVTPAPGAVNVPVSGNITATFASTVEAVYANIGVTLQYDSVTQNIYGSLNSNILTVPYSDLLYGTLYTATIPANSVCSVVYGVYNDAISWSFTTAQAPPAPTAPAINPNGGTFVSSATVGVA